MVKNKDKFIVAVKDVSQPGQIRQGKILGKYREREFAERDKPTLARRQGLANWKLGIFQKGRALY